MVAAARDPCAAFWTLFAAKEAAYKVLAKLRPATIFAHRRFEVGPRADELRYEGMRIFLEVEVSPDYVHVVASTRAGVSLAGVGRLPDDADSSAAARELLQAAMADRIGCARGDLEVIREPRAGSWDGLGPRRSFVAEPWSKPT
jgi:hypothetical protein